MFRVRDLDNNCHVVYPRIECIYACYEIHKDNNPFMWMGSPYNAAPRVHVYVMLLNCNLTPEGWCIRCCAYPSLMDLSCRDTTMFLVTVPTEYCLYWTKYKFEFLSTVWTNFITRAYIFNAIREYNGVAVIIKLSHKKHECIWCFIEMCYIPR